MAFVALTVSLVFPLVMVRLASFQGVSDLVDESARHAHGPAGYARIIVAKHAVFATDRTPDFFLQHL